MKNKQEKYKVLNSNGAVLIMTVVVISVVILGLVGIVTMKANDVSRQTFRVNEGLRFITVAEEMGRLISLGITLGNMSAQCVPGLVLMQKGGLNICLPSTDKVLNEKTLKKICIDHPERPGMVYCLNDLSVVKNLQAKNQYLPPIDLSGLPMGFSTEHGSSSSLLNPNYHSEEFWFPKADETVWPQSHQNVIRTPLCNHESHMALGCMKCDYPGVTCVDLQICPAVGEDEIGAGCANPYRQRIAVY